MLDDKDEFWSSPPLWVTKWQWDLSPAKANFDLTGNTRIDEKGQLLVEIVRKEGYVYPPRR